MGGAEKSLVTLLNLLPVSDMDIEVMRMSPAGRLEPLLPAGIRLARISLRRAGLIGRARFMAARAAMYLSRRFSSTPTHPNDRFWRFMRHSVPPLERQYDAAVAYQQGFPTAFVATRVNARRKIAWVNADVSAAGYDAQFNLPFYRAMTHIVTVSDTLRTLFCSRYPSLASRVTAIPDIIDARAIRRLAEETPSPYHDRDDDPLRPLRLLTVARMEHVRGSTWPSRPPVCCATPVSTFTGTSLETATSAQLSPHSSAATTSVTASSSTALSPTPTPGCEDVTSTYSRHATKATA